VTTLGPVGRAAGKPAPLPPQVAQALVDGTFDAPAHGCFAATCIDDRRRAGCPDNLFPNVAGGAYGLLLAARAVCPSYDDAVVSAPGFMRALRDGLLPVVVHADEQRDDAHTGCAFNDSMAVVGANLPAVLDDLLAVVDGAEVPRCVDAAALSGRIAQATAVSGGRDRFGEDAAARLAAVWAAGGTVEALAGGHAVAGVDVSWRSGFTLSREALWRGAGVQVFHLDAWSYARTALSLARALPQSQGQRDAGVGQEEAAAQMSASMLLSGLSTVSKMCAPETKLVLRG